MTARVTVTPDTLAAVVAGEPGTEGPAGFGGVATVSPGTGGKYGWLPVTFLPGMVLVADSTAGSTGVSASEGAACATRVPLPCCW